MTYIYTYKNYTILLYTYIILRKMFHMKVFWYKTIFDGMEVIYFSTDV